MATILFAGEPGFFPTALFHALKEKGRQYECVDSLKAATARLTALSSPEDAYAAVVTARYLFKEDHGPQILCADGGLELIKAHGHAMPCILVTNAETNGAMAGLDARTKANLHVHPCAAIEDGTLLALLLSLAHSDNGNGG